MPPPEKKKGRDRRTTLALALSCLACGIPVGAVTIDVENFIFMPDLLIKEPGTIDRGTHLALIGAAALSMVASVVVMLTTIGIRHWSPNNAMLGVVGFGVAAANQAAQIIILAFVYIAVATHPPATNPNQITLTDNVYDAKGKTYTLETWSCSMQKLFLAREPWSVDACSYNHYSRYTTILLVVTAFLLVGLGYWPVRKSLFGGRKNIKG
ncbi:hypothetical protein EJ04DRAFT_565810 [Polyplosphaeria fusca]|uniref:Uncharacterized protein n=1 Tax=Polyplosphaeria fusca TaxID=682080 RepID=A0A9P4UZQ4_9PLEO|nr:hypothetical protein EJ04DRAFT_565810 [Polyplosphaeria fusca]